MDATFTGPPGVSGAEVPPGQQLREFRLHVLGMGLRRFCEWLGVPASHVSNVERGRPFYAPPDDLRQLIRDGKLFPVCPAAARQIRDKIRKEGE